METLSRIRINPLLLLLILIAVWPFTTNADDGLQGGDVAPEFALVDQNRKTHRLSDYSGKWVVLYFYPKDDTPGCTKEACNFRDDIFKIRALNAEVLGVSLDSVESHDEFVKKYNLPFPLLSDADKDAAVKYNCLTKFGPFEVAKRNTFIINPEGKLARIYRQVDPKSHSAQVIADLTVLQE